MNSPPGAPGVFIFASSAESLASSLLKQLERSWWGGVDLTDARDIQDLIGFRVIVKDSRDIQPIIDILQCPSSSLNLVQLSTSAIGIESI